jgi:hypothetical protein
MMIALAAAFALATASPSPMPAYSAHVRRKRHAVRKRKVMAPRSSLEIDRLALRHALLHDFLVEAGSERPAFVDSRVVDGGAGLRIGPASVDIDFLGAPIVRARVTNSTNRDIDALVVVTVRDGRGGSARASTWIERLPPRGERQVELWCPTGILPESLRWSVTSL